MIYVLQSYGLYNKERCYNSCYLIDKTGLIIAPSTSKLSSFARTEIEIDRIDDKGISYHSIGEDLDEYVGELFVDDPERKQLNNGYLNVYMCLFSVDEFFKSLQNEEDLCQSEVIFELLSMADHPERYIVDVIDYFKRNYHHYVYFDLYNAYKDGLYGLSGGIDGYYDLLLSDLSEEDKTSFISRHKDDELWEELAPLDSDKKTTEKICVFRKDVLPQLVIIEFHDDDEEAFSWMADRLDIRDIVQDNPNYYATAEIKDDTYFCALIAALFYLYDFLEDFDKERALEYVGIYLSKKNNEEYKLFDCRKEYDDDGYHGMMEKRICEYNWSKAVEYAKQQAEKGNKFAIKVLKK